MLTHLGGNRYEFLMQLLIIKDSVVVVVFLDDSYEVLLKGKIRKCFVLFKTKAVMVKQGGGRLQGVNDPVFGL